MGKSSSSSSKKKRSKDSSQSRSRKRNKSKRNKSKKLKPRDASLSYSDDSESGSAVSLSSSSSEDDFRRQKSRTQKQVKGSKKRSQRRSYSSDSSEDSGHLRKKKRSKRKGNYNGKKRTRPRKKPRRDMSVSSASSESCSTCPSSFNSEESEFDRKRGRSERREKDRKRSDKVKSGRKRSRERSRSCSSLSRGSESDEHKSEEKFNTKRLRSVITVVNNFNDDENKEEIMYDHDDYPSCRSNDSNDGTDKRGFEHHSHAGSEEKDVISCALETHDVVREKTSEVSDPGDSSNCDDLESILRNRALENLRRFRGGPEKIAETLLNQKDANESEKIQSMAECKSIQLKSSNLDESLGRGASVPQQITKHDVASPHDQQITVGSCTKRPKLVRSVWRRESSNLSTTTRQATASKNNQANLMSGVTVGTVVPETSQTLTVKDGSENLKLNDTPDTTSGQSSSNAKTELRNGSSDKPQDETKEGSQFEQKTMSVMRGGEMVEVNYKVYIPKKTPALARRTLKR